MNVTLIEEGSKQELYSSSINMRTNYRTSILPPYSNIKDISINELRFSGLNYILLSLVVERPTVLNLSYSQPVYWFCIALEGECSLVEHKSTLSAHQYICWPMQKSVMFNVQSSHKILLIAIDSERGQDLNVYDKSVRTLDPIMYRILNEIRQCSEQCPIKCLFIESKILSLIHLIIESLQLKKTKDLGIELSKEDIQKLRAAKIYIVEHLDKSYTLIALARQVGLNDFKLKKGFRQLFGSTVFTYRHTMRMEKAKEMLQSGFQVNQISDAIGYKHPHHFSTAFKAYFDVLPSMIKSNA